MFVHYNNSSCTFDFSLDINTGLSGKSPVWALATIPDLSDIAVHL